MRPIGLSAGGVAAAARRRPVAVAVANRLSSSSCCSCSCSTRSPFPFSRRHNSSSQIARKDAFAQSPASPSEAPAASPTPRSIAKMLEWKPTNKEEWKRDDIVVNGYVRSVRSMKSVSFVTLGDGSSLAGLQALVTGDQANGLCVGAAVRMVGSWVPSAGKWQSHELHVKEVDIVGPSDAKTYPIQKKYHTPEYLRTIPHLRHRTPFNSALLRLRSDMIRSLSQFFASRDFVQTHPPLITSSDCEGAGEVFTLTPASDGEVGSSSSNTSSPSDPISSSHNTSEGRRKRRGPPGHFFRSPKYLTVSSQLHLEALAQAAGNVWTLSPTFRAERSDTSRHLSEFYMLEAEMSFVDDLEAVMDLAEDMLRTMATDLYGTKTVQDFLTRSQPEDQQQRAKEVANRWKGMASASRWPRITYTDAVKLIRQAGNKRFKHKEALWGAGLQAEHEKYIAEVVGRGTTPVFVTHYPRKQKAFYMRPTDGTDPIPRSAEAEAEVGGIIGETVDCFDLIVPECCEIAGGSMREHRLQPLLDAMQRHGMVPPPAAADAGMEVSSSDGGTNGNGDGDGGRGDGNSNRNSNRSHCDSGAAEQHPPTDSSLDWYVDLRRWGCPPHGGFGLGFDRLVSYLTGVPTVRDVSAFPRWWGRADC